MTYQEDMATLRGATSLLQRSLYNAKKAQTRAVSQTSLQIFSRRLDGRARLMTRDFFNRWAESGTTGLLPPATTHRLRSAADFMPVSHHQLLFLQHWTLYRTLRASHRLFGTHRINRWTSSNGRARVVRGMPRKHPPISLRRIIGFWILDVLTIYSAPL